jgi:hypothetical protein
LGRLQGIEKKKRIYSSTVKCIAFPDLNEENIYGQEPSTVN